MSGKSLIPTAVLSQRLAEVIAGRRVRAAVFTTYSFDPGFFELQVLPVLFDQPFSQVDKLRRIQLEEALSSLGDLAVYYDQRALSQDAEPAHLDYRRIDVRRKTGCFHPKLVLLLVDELPEEKPRGGDVDEPDAIYQSLIVGTLSANLTRGGWWESVECAHFEEIQDHEIDNRRCPFRRDLVDLLRRVKESAGPNEDHSAMETIREFLLRRTRADRMSKVSTGGRYFTRLFFGQQRTGFSRWLADLHLDRKEWNLEVISPFFDDRGAGPLKDLIEWLEPRECRVYLPRDPDGAARVSKEAYAAVRELAWWSELPGEVMDRGRTAAAERLPPRGVHAKVYRLWAKGGRDLLITGSVNLTSAGHSHAAAGNLEAAFLVDVTEERYPRRWWLQPLEHDAKDFVEKLSAEDEGLQPVPIGIALRYDWATGELAYRLDERSIEPLEVAETSGRKLFSLDPSGAGRWVVCADDAAAEVRDALRSSSFLLVTHKRGSWRVLVREENMAHRPSLLTRLTPEEILEYWALLTPAQRASFIETKLAAEATLEGISLAPPETLQRGHTLFDRFAGIYHSFGCLRRHIDEAIEEGREREAEARLMGARYDSLPSLLQKSLERDDGDPVVRYVTFLCARQLREAVASDHREFLKMRASHAAQLDSLLEQLPKVRQLVGDQRPGELGEFLDWYEPVFLKQLADAVGPP
ncbi:MAG: hypothetical protein GY722_00195 [bacterium]|nr:hypothetical protein [bacterium]